MKFSSRCWATKPVRSLSRRSIIRCDPLNFERAIALYYGRGILADVARYDAGERAPQIRRQLVAGKIFADIEIAHVRMCGDKGSLEILASITAAS